MAAPAANLYEFSERSLTREVSRELRFMAEYLRQKHEGAVAILAYGSCLRGVSASNTLMDFYLLTDDLAGVSHNALSRLACALVPPNVYYAETIRDGQILRAKYAVLPLPLFAKWMARKTGNPYFWARFSQPSALVYARDGNVQRDIALAISEALRTSFANAKALTAGPEALAVWTTGFSATYESELRSEKENRSIQIVAAYPDYYREAAALLAQEIPLPANQALRRLQGKAWSALRLIKAAFTFQGGADYIVWKIERHSGEKIILSPWQRKHPIIAGLVLLPKLLRKGAVR